MLEIIYKKLSQTIPKLNQIKKVYHLPTHLHFEDALLLSKINVIILKNSICLPISRNFVRNIPRFVTMAFISIIYFLII